MRVDDFERMLQMYATPSESYWRCFELDRVRELKSSLSFEPPVLEIGCGDGQFTGLVFSQVATAIDINPRAVERARREAAYLDVRCMDAGEMSFPEGSYGTVFANCVLEHIPGLQRILSESCRVLRPGGKLLATVPLVEMNEHLLVRSSRYADLRQRQLSHVNLMSPAQWRSTLVAAGFSDVSMYPYLFGGDVRFWDSLDFPGSIGSGRYRVATATNLLAKLFPEAIRQRARRRIARWLNRAAEARHRGEPCAAAIVATK